jgi:hypothetical protein
MFFFLVLAIIVLKQHFVLVFTWLQFYFSFILKPVIAKAIPLQAWSGFQGSRISRHSGHEIDKVYLMHRPPIQEMSLALISVRN